MLREITKDDYKQLMELYLHLHETEVPPFEIAKDVWEKIISSCTCVIIPNLTRSKGKRNELQGIIQLLANGMLRRPL